MTIYEKAEIGDLTIIGLIQEIKQKEIKVASKEKINEQIEKIEIFEKKNKSTQDFITRTENKIKQNKYNLTQQLIYLDAIDDLKRGKSVVFKTRSGKETVYKPLIDIEFMKNTLNKMQGRDFYYRINDGFTKYKVKRSAILKMQDNSFFLNKMKDGIEKAIKKTEKNYVLSEKTREKKITILRDVLTKIIEFNLEIDKHGKEDINKLKPDFKEDAKNFFNQKLDKSEKNGKYPILVKIYDNESIEF